MPHTAVSLTGADGHILRLQSLATEELTELLLPGCSSVIILEKVNFAHLLQAFFLVPSHVPEP